MKHLRVFGCDAFAHVPKDERVAKTGFKIQEVHSTGLWREKKGIPAV